MKSLSITRIDIESPNFFRVRNGQAINPRIFSSLEDAKDWALSMGEYEVYQGGKKIDQSYPEPQWKEVYAVWLSRDSDKQKTASHNAGTLEAAIEWAKNQFPSRYGSGSSLTYSGIDGCLPYMLQTGSGDGAKFVGRIEKSEIAI